MIVPRLFHPLPLISDGLAADGFNVDMHRRMHVGRLRLDPEQLMRFNQRIGHLLGAPEAIDPDGLASVARRLLQAGSGRHHPACIAERMRCAAAMDLMLRDRDWEPDSPAAQICAEVVAYLRSGAEQVIPNTEPVVGRLDDAILIERTWPFAEREVLLYCDFRRLRLIEAELRGVRPQAMHFHRNDYFEARDAEVRLLAAERRIGLGSYAPRPVSSNGMLLF